MIKSKVYQDVTEIYDVPVGEVFSELTILKEVPYRYDKDGNRICVVSCECVCGSIKEYRLSYLTSECVTSCGCSSDLPDAYLKRKYQIRFNDEGNTSKLYLKWKNLKAYRRENLYESWQDFEGFYEWSHKNGYQKDESLVQRIVVVSKDAVDSPDNCRWQVVEQNF